ncbi:DUF222 domain-containing protein [Knoellia pratensis]|uniref:DUF222 domain-containing protein n=1 Tax=Knoellia pratensis TaxID=3404796 RepID=UPI00361D39B3
MREHAPSLQQDGAGQVAQLARDVACSVPGGLWSTAGPGAGAYADPDKPQGVVWARVLTGEVAPALALTALKEMAKLEDQLRPEAVPTVAGAILDHGVKWGCADARRLRPHLLAMFGVEGELDDAQEKLRKAAYLSSPRVNDADITEYRLGLTPAQAATLEAAIGPLSKPAPNDVTGEKGTRPAEQRRAEALTAVCGRVAGEDAAAKSSPGGASTTLHVAMTLADLIDKLHQNSDHPDHTDTDTDTSTVSTGAGCGRVMASRAQATILGPAVVRQLACDADVLRSFWAPTAKSLMWVVRSGCSPGGNAAPCGTATAPAPTRAVTCPPGGSKPTTSPTGSTQDPRTWPTRPCCANATTPRSMTSA